MKKGHQTSILRTDYRSDITTDAVGSVRLRSPLSAWLKPGRANVLMTVESVEETAILDFINSRPTYALDDKVIEQAVKLR